MARKRGRGRRRCGTDAMFAKQRKRLRDLLVERDGPDCYFCHEETTSYDRSVEHLEALADGGADAAQNFRLAHPYCNSKVSGLTVTDKEWVRGSLRGKGREGWAEIGDEVKRRQVLRESQRRNVAARPVKKRRVAAGRVKAFGTVTSEEEAAAERALRAWGLDS